MPDILNYLNNELLSCRRCPRLVVWREKMALEKRRAYRDWDYWGKPVPSFGDPQAHVMAVGLAPGAHGSNRTGRMFTGDASGDFLYPALHRAGFANQPDSHQRDDGLLLKDLYITAVCRCAPPGNKPMPQELVNCRQYLVREMEIIQPKVIAAMGRVAFDVIFRILFLQSRQKTNDGSRLQSLSVPLPRSGQAAYRSAAIFAHGAIFELPSASWLVCSYHPSRQNTQTGRLTIEMFDQIWRTVRKYLT